jgi:hypothetical protein
VFARDSRDPKRPPVRLLFAPVLLVLAGCTDQGAETTTAKLQKIGNFYGPYCMAHALRGPASETEFRDYIKKCPSLQLQTLEVNPDDLDPLFKSDRDQQPFVMRFGLSLAGAGGKASKDVFAYEREGRGGKRLALYTTGRVELVDEAAVKALP